METQPQLLLLQKTMVVAEGVGRALNPELNMWQLAQPLIEDWIAENLGPAGAAAHRASRTGSRPRAACRIWSSAPSARWTPWPTAASGSIRSRSTALRGRRSRASGRLLPWALVPDPGGLLLGLLLH